MKQYKKIILLLTAMAVIMCGCGNTEDKEPAAGGMGKNQANAGNGPQEGIPQREQAGKNVVGMITEVFGNEITIQVGTMKAGAQGGNGTMGKPEGELSEGGVLEGGMSEGVMPGARGQKNMDSREGMSEEMMEEMQAMREQSGGKPSGGMGAGMAGIQGEDMSELVELTDETATYMIPVGTVVNQFGTEMTFSQLAADMYIMMVMDEDDVILSINVLG